MDYKPIDDSFADLIANCLGISKQKIINRNIHIVGDSLDSITVWGDRINQAKTMGYYFVICKYYKKETHMNSSKFKQYIYNFDKENIYVGYVPPSKFNVSLYNNIDNNSKVSVDIRGCIFHPKPDSNKLEISNDLEHSPLDKGYSTSEINDMNNMHSKFTKREYAAILLQCPDSGREWLDDMIKDKLKLNI